MSKDTNGVDASADGDDQKQNTLNAKFFSSEFLHKRPPYVLLNKLGKGAYGEVAHAECLRTGDQVAIKRLMSVTENRHLMVQAIRELKLLRLVQHPCLVHVRHVLMPENLWTFKSVYLVMEKMDCDLHSLLSVNIIPVDVSRDIMYQVLRGLRYLHLHNVLHRDLKPMNILVSLKNRCVKICDMGMARIDTDKKTSIFWTDYIATRWYRSPELICSYFARHSPAVDIWAVGCVFAEIINGHPLFPGNNLDHQINLVTDILGTPTRETLAKLNSEKAVRFFSAVKFKPRKDFKVAFPGASEQVIDMLESILTYDLERPSAEQLLHHPFFSKCHEGNHLEESLRAEQPNPNVMRAEEWSFEHSRDTGSLRQALADEILLWDKANDFSR